MPIKITQWNNPTVGTPDQKQRSALFSSAIMTSTCESVAILTSCYGHLNNVTCLNFWRLLGLLFSSPAICPDPIKLFLVNHSSAGCCCDCFCYGDLLFLSDWRHRESGWKYFLTCLGGHPSSPNLVAKKEIKDMKSHWAEDVSFALPGFHQGDWCTGGRRLQQRPPGQLPDYQIIYAASFLILSCFLFLQDAPNQVSPVPPKKLNPPPACRRHTKKPFELCSSFIIPLWGDYITARKG